MTSFTTTNLLQSSRILLFFTFRKRFYKGSYPGGRGVSAKKHGSMLENENENSTQCWVAPHNFSVKLCEWSY